VAADNQTILVVDDEPDIVKLVSISLKLSDFNVITAASGPETLEILKTQRPDLVLLDIMMPEMSGYEVCRTIKASPDLKDIPVVMLTAKGQKGDAEKGYEAGADDYIIKPFDPYDLGDMITRILISFFEKTSGKKPA
jgi:CheY-like chemotaxis protein